MARKRYQVFLSSTYEDLKDERFAVMESLHTMKCFVAGMEYFPAIDKDQFEYIKKIIDDCDYYLLILGGRYGTVPDGEDRSFTEKEYDYAVLQGKPIIALLCKNVNELKSGNCETDEKQKHRYESFRNKLKQGRIVDFWRDTSELKAKALAAVYTAIEEFPNVPGWIRGDSAVKEEILEEINSLRKENSMLKESILSPEHKCLEFLKKVIRVTYYENGEIHYILIPKVDIFKSIALILNSNAYLKLSIIEEVMKGILFTKRKLDDINSLSIKTEEVIRILILFSSLDLVELNDRYGHFYKLTAFGKRILFEIALSEN